MSRRDARLDWMEGWMLKIAARKVWERSLKGHCDETILH